MANALIVAIGFAGAWVIERGVLAYSLRRGLLVAPNERSSHSIPTPGIGGIAIVLPVLLWAALVATWHDPLGAAILLGGGALALLGLIDDLRTLSARVRFPVHVAAVVLAVAVVPIPAQLTVEPIVVSWIWLVGLLIAVALLWLVNLYNFMDGIDGYAGTQCVLYCGGVALLAPELWTGESLAAGFSGVGGLVMLLLGTTLGFLWFNWSPARIFLGDVGSGFLGYCVGLAGVALDATGHVPLVATLVLLTGFWLDATYTLFARMLSGQRFAEAHRSHLYQKLALRVGHAVTTALLVGYALLYLLPLAWLCMRYPAWQFVCVIAAAAPMFAGCVHLRAGMPEGGRVTEDGVR